MGGVTNEPPLVTAPADVEACPDSTTPATSVALTTSLAPRDHRITNLTSFHGNKWGQMQPSTPALLLHPEGKQSVAIR
jgi:hypothetical protein